MSTQTVMGRIPPLTLGWRLQMALREADISVQQMADELGMARTSLSRWLNDRGTPPRAVFVKQWALRTGVPVEWLMHGTVEPQPDDPARWAPWDSNPQPAD